MIEVIPERLLRVVVVVRRLVICKVGIKMSLSSELARRKVEAPSLSYEFVITTVLASVQDSLTACLWLNEGKQHYRNTLDL